MKTWRMMALRLATEHWADMTELINNVVDNQLDFTV
jgi:hypothetical protein